MSPSSGPERNLHTAGDRVTFCLQSRCWQLLSFRFQCWGFVMNQLPPSRFSKFLCPRAEKQGAPHRETASNCAPPCWSLFPVVGERKQESGPHSPAVLPSWTVFLPVTLTHTHWTTPEALFWPLGGRELHLSLSLCWAVHSYWAFEHFLFL